VRPPRRDRDGTQDVTPIKSDVVDFQSRAPETSSVFEEIGEHTVSGMSSTLEAFMTQGSMQAESFRLLRAKVQNLAAEQAFRCIGLVSSTSGEGKSTMALGLATALAHEPRNRILLIDADLRKSSIGHYLGLPEGPGLAEWLSGVRATVPITRVLPQGFFLLSAGTARMSQPDQLTTDRLPMLLGMARRLFDFVILDCPPVLPVADAVILQDHLDGFLFVVRAAQSPRETVLRALSHLRPNLVQGVIFNDFRELVSSYHSYAFRQYGEYR